jgi:hypothetical protein
MLHIRTVLGGIYMDKMNISDILLVGIPDALVWFTFGILLCNRDYFKGKNVLNTILKFIISSVIILSIVVYMRTIVSSIVYTSMISALLYALIFKYVWGFNIRISIFTGLLFVFMSSSVENIFTPFIIYMSKHSNVLSQSRFVTTLPIRIAEIILVYIVYIGKFNLNTSVLFKYDWREIKLSNKIATILLIVFIFTGFIISNTYTDILIKQSIYKLDLSKIDEDIHLMFYGVVLLILSGLLIMNRTRNYEEIKQEVRNIKYAFNLPPEKLFLNILQASNPEDIPKYQEVFTNYISKGVKINEK